MRRERFPATGTRDALVLAAAQIAEDLVSRCPPREETIFTFAASVVSAARAADPHALALAFELADGLLEGVPADPAWGETRGGLSTTKLFTWLLLQSAQGRPTVGRWPVP